MDAVAAAATPDVDDTENNNGIFPRIASSQAGSLNAIFTTIAFDWHWTTLLPPQPRPGRGECNDAKRESVAAGCGEMFSSF